MLHKIGYEATYRDGAFNIAGGIERSLISNPIPGQILEALELGRKEVFDRSGGDWIIVAKRRMERFQTNGTVAELIVYVPAGLNRRQQALKALKSFEKTLAKQLGFPVDTTFRSLEEDIPKCETCGDIADFVCKSQLPGGGYFCNEHAREHPDFGEHYPGYIEWEQLKLPVI